MDTSLELARALLPQFRANVLRGLTRTSGYYARAIGCDPSREISVIDKAMHVISAACAMACVPMAPIHFIESADVEWRGAFARAASESLDTLPAWEILATSSRLHTYSEFEFATVAMLLQDRIPKVIPGLLQEPEYIWRFLTQPQAGEEQAILERAMVHYEEIIARALQRKATSSLSYSEPRRIPAQGKSAPSFDSALSDRTPDHRPRHFPLSP